MTHNKQGRQAVIKEIISTAEVSSQEDLCKLLEKNGYETTQATLSRDLHELGIDGYNPDHAGKSAGSSYLSGSDEGQPYHRYRCRG